MTIRRLITLETISKIFVIAILVATWDIWRMHIARNWAVTSGQNHYWDVLLLVMFPVPALAMFMKHLSRTYVVGIAYMVLFFAVMAAFAR